MRDKNFAKGISESDAQVFREFVDTYQVMIRNTCLGFVNNREDAEDLAQEVFIEAYRSINSFRQDAKLSTWLYRIAINKSLNFIRNNKKRQGIKELSQISAGNQTDTSKYADPEAGIINEERKKIVKAAIRSLPENQQIAFVLHKQEDLAYKEIASIMDTSLSSVESLIHRAKLNLQKRLINYYKK